MDYSLRPAAIKEGKYSMKSIIIVGSGIAGALFARQLLKTNDCQITIFEAGPGFQTGNFFSLHLRRIPRRWIRNSNPASADNKTTPIMHREAARSALDQPPSK